MTSTAIPVLRHEALGLPTAAKSTGATQTSGAGARFRIERLGAEIFPPRVSRMAILSVRATRSAAASSDFDRLSAGGRWIRTSGSAPAATPLTDRGVKPQATAAGCHSGEILPQGASGPCPVPPIVGTLDEH